NYDSAPASRHRSQALIHAFGPARAPRNAVPVGTAIVRVPGGTAAGPGAGHGRAWSGMDGWAAGLFPRARASGQPTRRAPTMPLPAARTVRCAVPATLAVIALTHLTVAVSAQDFDPNLTVRQSQAAQAAQARAARAQMLRMQQAEERAGQAAMGNAMSAAAAM